MPLSYKELDTIQAGRMEVYSMQDPLDIWSNIISELLVINHCP